MANDAVGRRDGQARSFEEGLGAGGNARHDDVAARAREGHVGAEHVHAQALEEGGRNSLRDEHHDVVAVHPDAERGEKAALRGAVARIADFVGEARDGVRKLAVQERDGVLARDAHQTVFGDAAAGGGRREGKSACVVAGVGGRAGIGVAVHRAVSFVGCGSLGLAFFCVFGRFRMNCLTARLCSARLCEKWLEPSPFETK